MEEWGERSQIIGGAGDGGMVGFRIRDGHVSAIRKIDGSRSHHFEFGSETASEAGSKRFEISQEDETVAGGLLLNCDIASLTPKNRAHRGQAKEIKYPFFLSGSIRWVIFRNNLGNFNVVFIYRQYF